MKCRQRSISGDPGPPRKKQKMESADDEEILLDSVAASASLTCIQSSSHATVIQTNFVQLVDQLQPQLFTSMLDHCVKSNVDTDLKIKEKSRKLLEILMRYPEEYFDQFCDVIAGLHPGLFELLKKRKPSSSEKAIYLRPFVKKLKNSILKTGSRTDNQIDTQIDLDTQFVTLKLVKTSSGTFVSPAHFVNEDNVLPDDYQSSIQIKDGIEDLDAKDIVTGKVTGGVILLTGRAGVGKSTLTQYLHRLFAKGEWDIPQSVIFLLNLRKIARLESRITLPELLGLYSEYTTSEEDQPALPWVENNQEQMLLSMDGLDELDNFENLLISTRELKLHMKATPLEWCVNLIRRTVLNRSTLMFISRPFSSLSEVECDRKVDILGLTVGKIMKFVELNVREDRQTIVKQTLRSNPVLLSICSITFYCAALCSILEEDEDIDGESLTTYTRITAFIVTRLAMRRAKKQTNALLLSDDLSNSLPKMAALAYNGLPHTNQGVTRLVFDEDDFSKIGFRHHEIQSARNTGLLTCYDIKDPLCKMNRSTLQAEFIHLSIQELLHAAQTRLNENIRKQIGMMSFSGRFNMKQLFLFGLSLDKKSKHIDVINNALEADKNGNNRITLHQQEIEQVERELVDVHRLSCKDTDVGKRSNNLLLNTQIAYESQRAELAETVALEFAPSKALEVRVPQLTAVDMKALCFTMKNGSVNSLALRHTPVDDASAQVIGKHVSRHQLKKLVLEQTGVTEAGLECICDAITFSKTLRELHLHIGSYKTTMRSLAKALKCKAMKVLKLHCNISDKSFEFFVEQLKLNDSLTDLHIAAEHISKEAIACLAESLTTLCALQCLHLECSDRKIGSFDMPPQGIICSGSLRKLQISGRVNLRHLANGIRSSTSLEHLTLSCCYWEHDDTLICVDSLVKARSLVTLELVSCQIDDKAIVALGNVFTGNSSLRQFSVIDTKCFANASLASAIKMSQTLESLKIEKMYIGDHSMQHLADALATNTALKKLEMVNNFCSQTSRMHLYEAVGRSSLHHLTIIDQALTPLRMSALSGAVRNCRTLEDVSINMLTPGVFGDLATLIRCPDYKLQQVPSVRAIESMCHLANCIGAKSNIQYIQLAFCDILIEDACGLSQVFKGTGRKIQLQLVNCTLNDLVLDMLTSSLPRVEVIRASNKTFTPTGQMIEELGELFTRFIDTHK